MTSDTTPLAGAALAAEVKKKVKEAGDFAPQGPRDLDDPRSLVPR
jgi:hypothetical protein